MKDNSLNSLSLDDKIAIMKFLNANEFSDFTTLAAKVNEQYAISVTASRLCEWFMGQLTK